MRLLLDAHIAVVVARQLRERGHDVIAASERSELRAAPDPDLFDVAVEGRRAIVTYDLAGFRVLARERLIDDAHHFGLVLLDPDRMPQGKRYAGRLIDALHALLIAMPAEDALGDREAWLS